MREFDLIIEQQSILTMLEEYEAHLTSMNTVKESVETVMNSLQRRCRGDAEKAACATTMKVFTESYFSNASENMKKMKGLLEEELVEINALLLRCAEFHLQLTNDYYQPLNKPAAGDNQIRNGGHFAVNYSKLSSLIGTCENIVQRGDDIYGEIRDLISAVAGDVPGIDSMYAELYVAYKYLKRVNNLKASFKEYSTGSSRLEERLENGFATIKSYVQELGAYAEQDPFWAPEDELTKAVLALDYSRLEGLGFTQDQIDDLKEGVQNRKDLELLTNIVNGTYNVGFTHVACVDLSPEMQAALSLYNINLFNMYQHCADEEISIKLEEDFKAFVEGVMYKSEGGNASDYAAFFFDSTGIVNTTYFALVAQGCITDENRQMIEDTKNLQRVWNTVYQTIDRMEKDYHGYIFGDNHVVITELGFSEHGKNFILKLYLNDNNADRDDDIGVDFSTIDAVNADDPNVYMIYDEIYEKIEKMPEMYQEALVYSIIDGFAKKSKPASIAVNQLENGGVDAATLVVDATKYIPVVGPGVSSFVKRVLDIHKEIKAIEDLKKRIKDSFFVSTFYTDVADGLREDGTGRHTYNYIFQIADEDTAEAIGNWTLEGISVLATDGVNQVTANDKVYNKTKLTIKGLGDEAVRNAALYLIYGNKINEKEDVLAKDDLAYTGEYTSIYDIPADDFADALAAISNGIAELDETADEESKGIETLFDDYTEKIAEENAKDK